MLTACAPRLQEVGPPVDQPALEAIHESTGAIHTADGRNLYLRQWLPWQGPEVEKPKAVILALHGFNDHSGGLSLPAHGLARRGFAVYAYDQRGFGHDPDAGIWAGSDQLIADLKTATKLLHAKYPDRPLYLLGESMGAAVIMAAEMTPDPPQSDGIILESPAIWGWQVQSSFNRNVLDMAAHAVPWMTVVPTGLRLRASDNTRALVALARDPLVIKQTRVDSAYGLVDLMTRAYDAIPKLGTPRYLVLAGGNEAILNKKAVKTGLARFPDLPPEQGRIARYPKAYHLMLRDWDAPKIYDDIASWIEHPDQPLPSGADRQP